MEKALLGESSGGRDGLFRRIDKSTSKFTRRSDAITHGSPFQKAAALVDLAEDGMGIPEEILDQENFESVAKFYFIFIRFDIIWTLNYFAMIVLNFLEKPLWCQNNSAHSCNDREYFYLGQLPYLTAAESFVYEGITLIILVAHIFFPLSYEGFRIYWKNPLNWLKVIFLCILVVDLVAYAIYASPVAFNFLPFRIAPYIRVVFLILYMRIFLYKAASLMNARGNPRDLQTSIIILGGMLKTYVNVLALGLLFLLFSSWLAYVMFEDTQQGKIVFTSYGTTLYQMLILFTTSNNPDVWIPAYKVSRWHCLFFILYVLIGMYFVTNLVLAVIYDSFKDQLVKQVFEMDRSRKRILMKAFNLIDKNDAGYLNKEQCICLFEALNNYRTLPNISKEEFELIFDELDDSHDFKINLDEFEDLCNAIALRFQKEDAPSYFEYLPSIYHSPFSEKLKEFVRSPKFGYIISSILVMNLMAVMIETTLDIANNSAQKVWQKVEFVFGWIYVVEMALKIYACGFENYWRDGQNRFDFLITLVMVIGETVTLASPNGTFLSNGECEQNLIASLLGGLPSTFTFKLSWHLQLLVHTSELADINVHAAGHVEHSTRTFSDIHHKITSTGIALQQPCTHLEQIRYLLVARLLRLLRILMYVKSYRAFVATFLDLIPSLMPYLGTIFCVMCIYCSLGIQSYKDLTGTYWSTAYFISFYLITVLLLLNLEGSNSKSRRRSVGTKTRNQRVDTLMHHMLSAELNKPDVSNA
ncbi:hypothetical protein DKX38_020173 [Salix brachista]|uniref:EF-hand domain-containing protein n=1 Tax=Salix brachista TaxID=2182728 RepID=A0A5N5KIA1_9ROSI|nr:hypothetical protein DKX38_020173 [Salix brachista]